MKGRLPENVRCPVINTDILEKLRNLLLYLSYRSGGTFLQQTPYVSHPPALSVERHLSDLTLSPKHERRV
ncbi:hypothetical protein E2C01_019395 [Portunus trituberculatus]|uniref:Uncharacterized protein n=1 Tax=Portunus trituberculatus TaxID=210409 RepID=A0A5B7DYR8_PORTR|nr:hypothetical protein [Portunus trituberculatus]